MSAANQFIQTLNDGELDLDESEPSFERLRASAEEMGYEFTKDEFATAVQEHFERVHSHDHRSDINDEVSLVGKRTSCRDTCGRSRKNNTC